MPSEYMYQLAKETHNLLNPVSYGHLRGKLSKAGFSEIAMYAAVARHCEENEIKPVHMASDVMDLFNGCITNAFFIKTDDRYSYLRGQFHDLRHGNLDKDEPKSPEQRGKFLCNKCFLVKDGKESTGKNSKHTCKSCNSKIANSQQKAKRLAIKATEPKESHPMTPPAEAISEKPTEKRTYTKRQQAPKEAFEISEIIGDAKQTTITINCQTASLPDVLSALAQAKEL